MKLLTKEIEKRLPSLRATENEKKPIAQVKFFAPWSSWTWYATEYDPKQKLFFGYIKGLENEWGYFSLIELEEIKGPLGLSIERDLYFKPTPIKDLV